MTRNKATIPPPRYLIVVEAIPDSVPAPARLKRWLKSGLRAFGLRAIFAVESDLARVLDLDEAGEQQPKQEEQQT